MGGAGATRRATGRSSRCPRGSLLALELPSGGDDVIRGGPGRDAMDGGSGKDKLYGEEDRDALHTRDGTSGNDLANGGAGGDVCTTDRGDRRVSC
ncbi:MAG: hypothetical protein H0T57_05820 [Rubrobacter sp.]|nr:hypothetical protein [Rubrobacter sp.]